MVQAELLDLRKFNPALKTRRSHRSVLRRWPRFPPSRVRPANTRLRAGRSERLSSALMSKPKGAGTLPGGDRRSGIISRTPSPTGSSIHPLCWGASAQPTPAFCRRQRRPKPLPLVATCPRFQTSAPERHQPHSPESRSSTTQRTPVGQPGG